jgi:uncharacterized protein
MNQRPLLLFAPGAGAPSSHRWMIAWAERLRTIGDVVAMDYPYMLAGSRRPDPQAVLISAHRAALHDARQQHTGPTFLIGKSMGGRIGCHVALEEQVQGVICLGYPLCGGGDPQKLRDKVLLQLSTPVLFLQGTRDSLCPLELLETVRSRMTAPNELHVVAGGDHSLLVSKTQLKSSGITQEEVDQQILGAIAAFVTKHSTR